MKKLLSILVAFCGIMAYADAPEAFYLRGSMDGKDWAFTTDYTLDQIYVNNDIVAYQGTFNTLNGDFKVVANDDWNSGLNFGGQSEGIQTLEIGSEVGTHNYGNGNDFSANVTSVKVFFFYNTSDANNSTIKIEAIDYTKFYVGIACEENGWPLEGESMHEVNPDENGIATIYMADIHGFDFAFRYWDGNKGVLVLPLVDDYYNARNIDKDETYNVRLLTQKKYWHNDWNREIDNRDNKSFHIVNKNYTANVTFVLDIKNKTVQIIPTEFQFEFDNTNTKWTDVKIRIWNNDTNKDSAKCDGDIVMEPDPTRPNIFTAAAYLNFEPKGILFYTGNWDAQTVDTNFVDESRYVASSEKESDGKYKFTELISTGIESVEAEVEAAEPVYFNLQGVKVENPSNGIFIKVQGNSVKKVIR